MLGGAVGDFDLLIVCTGNVARSPALQAMLVASLCGGPRLDGALRIRSAGTAAMVGSDIDRPMRAALEHRGVRPGPFAARQLEAGMIGEADLVLAASRRHRSAVVQQSPSSLGKTFTILEFARYCDAFAGERRDSETGPDPVAGLVGALAFAQDRRGTMVPRRPEDDDIADPHRRARRVYRRCAQTLDSAASSIVKVVVS